MIESGLRPGRGVVARGAGGGEARRDVIRIIGSGVIGLVTSVAVCGQRCVVVVGMACSALHRDMRTGKWEYSVVVIERRRTPAVCRVARRAVRRKSRRDVIGAGGAVEVGLMARVAGGWR